MITKLKIESNPFAKVNLIIQGSTNQIRMLADRKKFKTLARTVPGAMKTRKSWANSDRAVCEPLSPLLYSKEIADLEFDEKSDQGTIFKLY